MKSWATCLSENFTILLLTSVFVSAYSVRMNLEQVIALLRKRQGKQSLREFAAELGVSAGYLSDIFCGNRAPGATILDLLGIEKQTTIEYAKKASK